ncbi:MAG: response regulator [Planctomycetia bacterium]|nr:response regulator [Planctomycetia bacterium]
MAHILVVDDSSVDRTIAGRLLERNSEWTIVYAGNGKEALAQLAAQPPDLIITDLLMPEMNGLELVETIRDHHPQIPVILMTGVGSEAIAAEAIRKGAASYVPKHELVGGLAATVTRLLATVQPQQTRQRLQNCLDELQYVVPNDLSLLSALTRELRQVIDSRKLFSESDCLRFVTAVDEALMNAYFHGNLEIDSEMRADDPDAHYSLANQRRQQQPYCDRRIYVRARFTAGEAAISVRDEGAGFDLDSLPDPTAPEYIDRPYGRGILLMRVFTDEVRFNDRRNEVTLIKRSASD